MKLNELVQKNLQEFTAQNEYNAKLVVEKIGQLGIEFDRPPIYSKFTPAIAFFVEYGGSEGKIVVIEYDFEGGNENQILIRTRYDSGGCGVWRKLTVNGFLSCIRSAIAEIETKSNHQKRGIIKLNNKKG